ncbi:MAG: hypothetical protein ABIR17_06480 [Pseudolysinimonas sp.]|uniref:hypothetical protein n=1 Tax=Pseudolysinimonas sp. TaxID=2680009 RepID=UPI003264BCB3
MTSSSESDRSGLDTGRPIAQAALTVAISTVTLVAGVATFSLATSAATLSLALLAAVVNPILGIWILAVALITVLARRRDSRGRARWYIGAGVAVAVISAGINVAPNIVYNGPSILLLLGLPGLISIASFATCVAVGSIGAERLTRGRLRLRPGAVVSAIGTALLVIGGALVVAVFGQWVQTSFTLFGSPPAPTDADGVRYLVTAGAALTFTLAATGIGFARRSLALGGWGVAFVAVALLTALTFSVPTGRWFDQDLTPPTAPGGGGTDCQFDPSQPGCGG